MLFNFVHITLPKSPNYCLVAPGVNYNKWWLQPKHYNVSKVTLKKQWDHMLMQQPRVAVVESDNDQVKYVQSSKTFKLKDIIIVQFNEIDSKHSSLYLYSHSVSGYWDFGVNCKRIHTWLAGLK